MDEWQITLDDAFTCTNPVFVEGLPGIGNVGKIAIDYLIDTLQAKKIGTIFSYQLPPCVFVTEKNLVALPVLELYAYTKGNKQFIFLTGDAQPSQELSSYTLSQIILHFLSGFGKPTIITLGGIGLDVVPEKINIYITGNNVTYLKSFTGVKRDIYGVVGPIFGVTGLLLGLAKTIPSAALLAQTSADPMHIGLREAKVLLGVLTKKLGITLSYTELDKEIALVSQSLHDGGLKPLPKELHKLKKYQDLNYIG
jgi:proteasome assembly chaperone (PAC2) family protein